MEWYKILVTKQYNLTYNQTILQFHFKDKSNDRNESETEEFKLPEINSATNDQRDSQ